MTIGRIFRINSRAELVAYLGLAFLTIAIHFCNVEKATRQLPVAEQKPPLLAALRLYAREQALWYLWLVSILTGICCWLIWVLARQAHSDLFLVYTLLFVLGAVALLYSLMIALHEIPSAKKARISPLSRH